MSLELKSMVSKLVKRWQIYPFAIGVLLLLVAFMLDFLSLPEAFSFLSRLVGYLLFLIVFISLVISLMRWLISRFFFKVRNRIIVSYILTGILPLGLLFLLIYLCANIFMIQLVSFHMKHVLEKELIGLGKIGYEFALELSSAGESDARERFECLYQARNEKYPALQVMIWQVIQEPELFWKSAGAVLPSIELGSAVDPGSAENQIFFLYNDEIYLLSSIQKSSKETVFIIVTAVPLGKAYLEKIEDYFDGRIMFSYGYLNQDANDPESDISLHLSADEGLKAEAATHIFSSPRLQEDMKKWAESNPGGLDYFTSYTYAEGLEYGSEGFKEVAVIGIINTRFSFILKTFIQGAIPSHLPVQEVFITAIIVIGSLFGAIELIALIISVVLSRSITKLIGQLHKKTNYISKGDLAGYSINSRRKDQLGELAGSFDKMSDDLQAMLIKVKEKERLEHELAIAQEVQNLFFPKQLPRIGGVGLLGKCIPARMVSGDYYDFITHEDGHLDFFIGDICGKGISAALLMASSHTFLRIESSKRPVNQVSTIVSHFNNHLAEYASENKFSTLFYGRLEAKTNKLHYCNAGHLPPLIIRNHSIIQLTIGGIVPGLFPDRDYDQDSIQLEHGDLLVAYTDGFSEATNSFEEEFGENRLAHLFSEYSETNLEKLYTKVIHTVQNWSSGQDQNDDMTIILVNIQ